MSVSGGGGGGGADAEVVGPPRVLRRWGLLASSATLTSVSSPDDWAGWAATVECASDPAGSESTSKVERIGLRIVGLRFLR